MKIEISEIWKDRFCNECNKQSGVKELYLGEMVIALCEECRQKLAETLTKEAEDGEVQDL